MSQVGIFPQQTYLWPMEQPPIAPSTELWIDAPTSTQGGLLMPASQFQISNPPGQSAPVVKASVPVVSIEPRAVFDERVPVQTVDTVAAPNCLTFIGPGLEVQIRMNERGDLYAKQINGPNAGKSYNLTEGKWL